ncbi:hypothetical protein G6F46_015598 [Rhizopus delemar]|nr:hypothetical protein G6F46_015598 [Rhizopus delemar]
MQRRQRRPAGAAAAIVRPAAAPSARARAQGSPARRARRGAAAPVAAVASVTAYRRGIARAASRITPGWMCCRSGMISAY